CSAPSRVTITTRVIVRLSIRISLQPVNYESLYFTDWSCLSTPMLVTLRPTWVSGSKMARKSGQAHKGHQAPLFNVQDPRAVRSREALRGAFLELLETKALDQITIQEITERAGVGYVTFFRHHGTKESLLNEIAADQIRRLVELTLPVLDAVDSRAASI